MTISQNGIIESMQIFCHLGLLDRQGIRSGPDPNIACPFSSEVLPDSLSYPNTLCLAQNSGICSSLCLSTGRTLQVFEFVEDFPKKIDVGRAVDNVNIDFSKIIKDLH